MIHAKKQMNYLKVINFIGIVSVSITLFLTLEGFFTFYNSLISQRENFKFINWIYMVNIELSYALSERYLLELNRLNYLQTPDSMNEIFNEELYNENISRIRKSKDQMILLYNTTNPNIQVFEIIKNKKITQNIYFNKTESSQMQLSIKYSILLQISGMFYIIEDLDPYQIMAQQNQANYLAINNEVSSIFNELNSVYQSQLNSILSQSETQLFVIFSVSLFVLSCIVPSFIFTKIRQQKMLELFATFDPQSLKEILIQLTYQLQAYGGLDKSQTLASKSNISNMNQTQISKQAQVVVNVQKKLNISRTSTIKYSIKYLVLALLFIFGLIMIYPSFFYVTVRKFVDNSKIIFQFNSNQYFHFLLNK